MKKTTIHIPIPIKSCLSGKTTFRGGTHLTRKDRLRKRSDKYARRQRQNDIHEE